MKHPLICLLCLAGFALSAEPVKFPLELGTLTTVGAGSRTFDGVKVVSSDAIGIKIMHEGGTSRIAYDKLPAELRQRFAVDPEAAKAQLRKEAEQNAAHDRAVGDGMGAPGQEGATPGSPEVMDPGGGESQEAFINRILGEEKPDATGKTRAEKIVLMKAYVARLQQEMTKLAEDLKHQEERYSRGSARAANGGKTFSRYMENYTESGTGYTESRKAFLARREGKLAGYQAKYQEAWKKIYDKLKEAEKDLFELESGG